MATIKSDIVIIGGGMIGLTVACAIAEDSLKVTVIEAADPTIFKDKGFDGRTCAIAYSSRKFFEKIGVWEGMSKNAGDILDIRIIDGESPLFLHYDHKEVGDEPMGHIVENRHIRKSLMNKVNAYKNIELLAPAKYKHIKYDADKVSIDLEDGNHIEAKLLIAADGRNSQIRENANIPITKWSYNQTAIVCTVYHEKQHNGVAVERFLPSGPFASLPLGNIDGGKKKNHYSSLVWTEKDSLIDAYMNMSEDLFNEQMCLRFGDWLGEVKIIGDRWSYPLSLISAKNYTAKRMCLVGDAAHGMHPIAGQGLNYGLRDAEEISNLVKKTASLGLDIGGMSVLEQYQKARKFDNISMLAATDIINRLFSNDIAPIKAARRVGLAIVNQLPPIKKIFMKQAMGSHFLTK